MAAPPIPTLSGDIRNPAQWVDTTAPYTCGSLCRGPEHLVRVASQYGVDDPTNERYRALGPITRCNCYVNDVTRALGCEVPNNLLLGSRKRVDGSTEHVVDELNANRQIRWLVKWGPSHGWREVDRLEARRRADKGFPVVVGYDSGTDAAPGHVAIGLPTADLDPKVLRIAQAGGQNFYGLPLEKGFGSLPVRFFTHD